MGKSSKIKMMKTTGPIHFEDLEPHRFEDLIRELIYDYKDWQSIEATGRSGSDDGFDIRAYEKVKVLSQNEDDDDNEKIIHPMEGNMWMIQGKRQKKVGPKAITDILSDISAENPPYGYILAAATNFSKKSYDVFREELRKKGVMEFYLWGRAELESMVYLPKNDRILFLFCGISLIGKKRTKATEARSTISIKNKLYKVLGKSENIHQSVLIRDLYDNKYPFSDEYSDFDTHPRWNQYSAFRQHPLGFVCHIHKYYAYIDTEKKEWDYTEFIDLENHRPANHSRPISQKREDVQLFFECLQRKKQGFLLVNGLIKYSNISIVDTEGDCLYDMPHLYIDSSGNLSPFSGEQEILTLNKSNQMVELDESFKRINVFPKTFKKIEGEIYSDEKIILTPGREHYFFSETTYGPGPRGVIYDLWKQYEFLKPGDFIQIEDPKSPDRNEFIQITYKFTGTKDECIRQSATPYCVESNISAQLGRTPGKEEKITA